MAALFVIIPFMPSFNSYRLTYLVRRDGSLGMVCPYGFASTLKAELKKHFPGMSIQVEVPEHIPDHLIKIEYLDPGPDPGNFGLGIAAQTATIGGSVLTYLKSRFHRHG